MGARARTYRWRPNGRSLLSVEELSPISAKSDWTVDREVRPISMSFCFNFSRRISGFLAVAADVAAL